MNRRSSGFTLTEILLVLAIIAILAVTVVPKFINPPVAKVKAAADLLVSDIRYAQSLAMSHHTAKIFTLLPDGYSITDTLGTDREVKYGTGDYVFLKDVTLTGSSFIFDYQGTPTIGQDIIVSASDSSVTVSIAAQTGRVGIR